MESLEIAMHKQEVEEYRILTDKLMFEEWLLRCEFYYAQNLPLPKIPVNEQFYKRLLWLYLFNVHVYGSEQSYMYPHLKLKLAELERNPPTIVGITEAKLEDVKGVLKYLTPKGQTFFNEYFSSMTSNETKDDSILSSDED